MGVGRREVAAVLELDHANGCRLVVHFDCVRLQLDGAYGLQRFRLTFRHGTPDAWRLAWNATGKARKAVHHTRGLWATQATDATDRVTSEATVRRETVINPASTAWICRGPHGHSACGADKTATDAL